MDSMIFRKVVDKMEGFDFQKITENICDRNISYTLPDHNAFNYSEYKVLKNKNEYFVRLNRVISNGKIRLLYYTSAYSTLASYLTNVDSDTFFELLCGVFQAILFTEKNGFLDKDNLVLDVNRIFVEPETRKVKLLYIPLDNSDSAGDCVFEFRKKLVDYMFSVNSKSSNDEVMNKLYSLLLNNNFSYEQIMGILNKNTIDSIKNDAQTFLRFYSTDGLGFNFIIRKSPFVIGRSSTETEVDGIINSNGAISRGHCEIIFSDGVYYIRDRGSTHGTSLNGIRLRPNISYKIKTGDEVKLAFSSFGVEIMEDRS